MLNPAPLMFAGFLLAQDSPKYREAATASAQAYYIQSGLQAQVVSFQDKYTPISIKKYGVVITTLYQITVDKKIEINFTF